MLVQTNFTSMCMVACSPFAKRDPRSVKSEPECSESGIGQRKRMHALKTERYRTKSLRQTPVRFAGHLRRAHFAQEGAVSGGEAGTIYAQYHGLPGRFQEGTAPSLVTGFLVATLKSGLGGWFRVGRHGLVNETS